MLSGLVINPSCRQVCPLVTDRPVCPLVTDRPMPGLIAEPLHAPGLRKVAPRGQHCISKGGQGGPKGYGSHPGEVDVADHEEGAEGKWIDYSSVMSH